MSEYFKVGHMLHYLFDFLVGVRIYEVQVKCYINRKFLTKEAACLLAADEELIFLAIKYLLHRGRGGGWKSSDKLLQYNPQIFPLINVIELPPRSA